MINVTDLRKIFTVQGVKGASKWKREDFNSAIIAAEFAAYAEDAERTPAPVAEAPAKPRKRGTCTECGRKLKAGEFGELCAADREYAEWENAHGDEGHGEPDGVADGATPNDCPVCHPELDPRKPVAKTRSRAGMVIVAKGTEIHKSLTFKEAAEKIGWTVEIAKDIREVTEDGETFQIERHVATATRGEDVVELAWDGRAYDYPSSSATLGGKARKVRNLKEALRFIER